MKRFLSLVLCTAVIIAMPLYIQAATTTQQTLQNKVNSADSAYRAESQALADAKEDTAEAKEEVSVLNEQSQILLSAIQEINEEIAKNEEQISDLQQQIADKNAEITEKQIMYDSDKEKFKETLGAMQEMHDGGTIALLNTTTNLYQLLTFPEILQDISQDYTAKLEQLETEHTALEQAKAELAEQQQLLESAQAALQSQQEKLDVKQKDLEDSLQQANAALTDKQAAEQAQSLITQDAKKKWEEAVAEQDRYIKSQLGSSDTPTINCGLNFQCPLASYKYISTNFGDIDSTHSKPHAGTDFAAPAGTPIMAAEDGYVLVARGSSSYGNYVVLYHGIAADGHKYSTLYAHMTSYCVCAGQSVHRGDVIGYVGSTGHSYGNHLHLELWQGNIKLNPLLYVPRG